MFAVVDENRGMDMEIRLMVNGESSIGKLEEVQLGVVWDRKISIQVKVNIIRTVVRPVTVYGAEKWSTTKTEENRPEVNEMGMLR